MRKKHSTDQTKIQNYQNLRFGLHRAGGLSKLRLHSRLVRCEGVSWERVFYCRSPACPSCRDRYIGRQRRDTKERFQGASNTELGFATVILGGTQTVWNIGHILEKGRRDLRNLINRRRRTSAIWNEVELVGWIEVDAYDPSDLPLLGSDKSRQLTDLLSGLLYSNGPIWVPTIHSIVRIPQGLAHTDIESAFQAQWSQYRQTDVREFYADRSVDSNISDIVNYANKHDCVTSLAGFRSPWDTSWQVCYYDWLNQYSRGFLSLKIRVGRKK